MGLDRDDWSALVERVRSRDPAAEREMVERTFGRITAILRPWKARRETIEDLAQEVYLRLFDRLDQYRGGSFPAWVDAIARRVCFDALRKQRVRPEWTFTDLGAGAPDDPVAPPREDWDAAEVVAGLLARLPPAQAWLLREVELAERSIGDVAREMGWTAVGGRLRLFRARQALKKLYDEWNETNATPE